MANEIMDYLLPHIQKVTLVKAYPKGEPQKDLGTFVQIKFTDDFQHNNFEHLGDKTQRQYDEVARQWLESQGLVAVHSPLSEGKKVGARLFMTYRVKIAGDSQVAEDANFDVIMEELERNEGGQSLETIEKAIDYINSGLPVSTRGSFTAVKGQPAKVVRQ